MISLVILLELALSIVYGYFILYYVENIAFFSNLPADGLHDWGILFVISLEFQEIKYQPLPMTQPWNFKKNASTVPYGTAKIFRKFPQGSFPPVESLWWMRGWGTGKGLSPERAFPRFAPR